MENKRIDLEYPLSAKSRNIVWGLIGNAAGLEKWLADHVVENGQALSFTWGEPWTEQDTKTAHIQEIAKNHDIRLHWDYHEDDTTFWEMRIEKSELTDLLTLHITDYAESDDIDYLHDLWDKNLERLHRVSGIL